MAATSAPGDIHVRPLLRFEHLLIERPAQRVLRVSISNPAQMNGLNAAIHDEIVEILSIIDSDPDVRCSIITGAGKAFCAGGAVDDMPSGTQPDVSGQVMRDFRSGSALL